MKTSLRILTGIFAMAALLSSCKKDDDTKPDNKVMVNTRTITMELAWDNSNAANITNKNPRCFVDADSGKSYNITEAPSHASEIDFFWTLRAYSNDGHIASADNDEITNINYYFTYAKLGIANWTTQNHTIFDILDGVYKSDFDKVETVADLKATIGEQYPFLARENFNATQDDLGKIWVFETAQHKRGLIKFNAATFGKAGTANITIKMEP